MRKNKYLLLGSSLGVLALLVVAAIQENFRRDWRRIQKEARLEDRPISVQLRQIVNPALRTTDRCVSCHVSMGAGEQSVSGHEILRPHPPVVHDPAEFGCTVCHGGQGQATEKADAHGDVHFWPEPMLPAKLSYAGCGTCHAPPGVPNRDGYRQARLAFERLDCLACHRVDGRGATIRPGGGGMEGPDLSYAGLKGYDRDWYRKHIEEREKAASGPWRNSFGPVSEADREALATYLATLVGAPRLMEAKSLFHSSGCLGCHKVSGTGGDEGPELTRAGEKDPGQMDFSNVPGKASVKNWIAEHFRSPLAVVAGSQMPVVALPERDIELLTMYTLSLRRRDLPETYSPKDRVRVVRFGEREFASDGATIFGAFCSGCHGPDGLGRRSPGMPAFPSPANPDFLALASDEFIRETVRLGRPGRRMPAWGQKEGGLRPDEIDKVVAHLRRLGGVPAPARTAGAKASGDTATGSRLFAAACAGCHGPEGLGGEGPALNNPVLLTTATDEFLIETIARGRRGTAMEGFLEPSVARRTLSRGEIESIVTFIRSLQGDKK